MNETEINKPESTSKFFFQHGSKNFSQMQECLPSQTRSLMLLLGTATFIAGLKFTRHYTDRTNKEQNVAREADPTNNNGSMLSFTAQSFTIMLSLNTIEKAIREPEKAFSNFADTLSNIKEGLWCSIFGSLYYTAGYTVKFFERLQTIIEALDGDQPKQAPEHEQTILNFEEDNTTEILNEEEKTKADESLSQDLQSIVDESEKDPENNTPETEPKPEIEDFIDLSGGTTATEEAAPATTPIGEESVDGEAPA